MQVYLYKIKLNQVMGNRPNKSTVLTTLDRQKEGEENIRIQADLPLAIPASVTKVTLQYANGELDVLYIDSTLTCSEFKQLLYLKTSKTLQPRHMILKLNGKRIQDHEVLGDILAINDVVVQQKLPLSEISCFSEVSKIVYQSQAQCDYSSEKGTVTMPCGHPMSREAIIFLIKTTIKEKKGEIFCPYPKCDVKWSYSACKKVGCFTREEDIQFSQGLSFNYRLKFSKPCPGCHILVQHYDNTVKKALCSSAVCKFGPFCFSCLQKWRSSSLYCCGNVSCQAVSAEFDPATADEKIRIF